MHRRELRVDAHPAAQRVEAVAAGDHAHQQHHLGVAGDDRHLAQHLLGVLALSVEHPGDHEVHLAQRRHRGEGALDQPRVRREGDGAVLGHDAQPGTVRGAAQRGAERRRVGEDPDPRPEREALALDAVHDVQEVVHSPGLHDPGGVEHLVQGAPRQRRAAHVMAGRQMGLAAGRAQHDQRGATGQAPGDPGELARVPHRLQRQPDHAHLLVVLPVLEGVVEGDVGAVAHAHELVQADPAGIGAGQEHRGERAGLAGERGPPRARHVRGE